MPNLTDAQIAHWESQCAALMSAKAPWKVTRYSPVVSTTGLITVPDDCIQVLDVLWDGEALDQYNIHEFRNKNIPTHWTGKPTGYFAALETTRQIQFYPKPMTATISVNVDTGYNDGVIIAYQANTTTFPTWFMTRMYSLYIQKCGYLAEGRIQRTRSARYFDGRFDRFVNLVVENWHMKKSAGRENSFNKGPNASVPSHWFDFEIPAI